MSLQNREGKLRPTLPSSSDILVPATVGEPAGQRGACGRFASSNGIARGAGWKHQVAESLGRGLKGEAGELGRDAYRLYRAFLAELPYDCATSRALLAERARDTVLSARYGRRAAEVGLDTPEGREALRMAIALGARAERVAITSLDISVRLAKSAGPKPGMTIVEQIEAEAERYLAEAKSDGGEP